MRLGQTMEKRFEPDRGARITEPQVALVCAAGENSKRGLGGFSACGAGFRVLPAEAQSSAAMV